MRFDQMGITQHDVEIGNIPSFHGVNLSVKDIPHGRPLFMDQTRSGKPIQFKAAGKARAKALRAAGAVLQDRVHTGAAQDHAFAQPGKPAQRASQISPMLRLHEPAIHLAETLDQIVRMHRQRVGHAHRHRQAMRLWHHFEHFPAFHIVGIHGEPRTDFGVRRSRCRLDSQCTDVDGGLTCSEGSRGWEHAQIENPVIHPLREMVTYLLDICPQANLKQRLRINEHQVLPVCDQVLEVTVAGPEQVEHRHQPTGIAIELRQPFRVAGRMFNEQGIAVLSPHGKHVGDFIAATVHDGIRVTRVGPVPIESRHHRTAKCLVLLFQPQVLGLVDHAWGVGAEGQDRHARTPSMRVAESPLDSAQG